MDQQPDRRAASSRFAERVSFGGVAVALATLLALTLYLLTMPPGLTWWYGGADSGDLASAAVTLGIPHPTGYPLYTAAGWLVTRLPFGEPAGRLNVMDALIAAAAAAIAGLIVIHLNRTLAPSRTSDRAAPRVVGGDRRQARAKTGKGGAARSPARGASAPKAEQGGLPVELRRTDASDARFSAAPAIAAVTVLTLATAGLYWSQAIITEVYALNALLCVMVAWLTLRLIEPGSDPVERPAAPFAVSSDARSRRGLSAAARGAGNPTAGASVASSAVVPAPRRRIIGDGAALWLGLAQGLALANHLTAIFALAGTAAALAVSGRRPRAAAWWRYAGGIAAGLSLYLLLPLRAAQSPDANWGDPRTPGRFLTHVTGGSYGGSLAWTDLGGNLRELVALVRLLLGDVALWALPAALYGVAQGWMRARGAVAYFGMLMLLSLLFAAGYRVGDHAIYLLPAYVGYVVFAGLGLLCGVEACTRAIASPRPALLAGAVTVVLLSGLATSRALLAHDLHGDRTPAVFADRILNDLPPDATILTVRDDSTFALQYAQIARGRRRDIHIVTPNQTAADPIP